MGNLKTTRYDIGAEVLSILTRGMYPDPKDTLREYVQNGIDANAKIIYIRVRKNTITIEDDGIGMNEQVLRRAARIGVSDKNPGKDVGFMGIGIYSSFHLCDTLTIYSRKEKDIPCYLFMDFKGMRSLLSDQNEKRLNHKISSEELIDLQTLLERYVILDETTLEEFPGTGTRIEMEGLNTEFLNDFSDFKNLAEYLQLVVPLEFDKTSFSWAELIENKIDDISTRNGQRFEKVKLLLQVNGTKEWLFRPYKDSDFHENKAVEPFFIELKTAHTFYGVLWGCLNSTRNKIANTKLRGFLIRKQGFAIGDRRKLLSYFRPVYYDRYIGEAIVVNEHLLPNAARNDFAYSHQRTIFYDLVANAADEINLQAHQFQEFTLGDEQLNESIQQLKEINSSFTLFEKDPNKLIDFVVEIRKIKDLINSRLERNSIRPERKRDSEKFLNAAKTLEESIQSTIKTLTEQSRQVSVKAKKGPSKATRSLASIPTTSKKEFEFHNLISLIESLDIPLTEDLKELLTLIDERVLQSLAENQKQYFEILKDLKDEFERNN
jgi:hypothetical protein